MLYQSKLNSFVQREENLRKGMIKAYALIFSYCNNAMQSHVKEHPEFAKSIEHDPIKLLEAIQVLMHDPIHAQYPVISMTEALARLVNVKQAENESLLDYVNRFKQLRDVAVSHMGTELLYKFCEYQENYKSQNDQGKLEWKTKSFEMWMSYLLIRGSDQSKYGSLTKNFTQQFSLGNDQYPKTMETAVDVLSNHRFDQKFIDNQQRQREQAGKGDAEARKLLVLLKRIRTRKSLVSFVVKKVTGARSVLTRTISHAPNGLLIILLPVVMKRMSPTTYLKYRRRNL